MEAARVTPVLIRFNHDAMPSLKSLNLSKTQISHIWPPVEIMGELGEISKSINDALSMTESLCGRAQRREYKRKKVRQ